jgi:hypothetical protein
MAGLIARRAAVYRTTMFAVPRVPASRAVRSIAGSSAPARARGAGAVRPVGASVSASAALALAAALAVSACGGDPLSPVNTDAGVDPNARCTKDEDCGGPGLACNVSTGVCFDKNECSDTKPCSDPQRVCQELVPGQGTRCVPRRCTDVSECSGTVCMNEDTVTCSVGECRCTAPCQGGCPGGQGCCVRTDTCQALPPRCMGMTCPLGEILSVTATGTWDARDCALENEVCRCEPLPPLTLGDVGLYSAIAFDGARAVVSAYSLDYGDLVVGRASEDLGLIEWSFVDGVPTSTRSADYTGRTDGPRGGLSRPGLDTGLHTDLATAGGVVHVAYQQRDGQDLRYGVAQNGAWRLHTVESAGDTGLYTSLALDAQGQPRLAYLAAREDIGMSTIRRSVLRLAVATTPTPTQASDWRFRDLDSLNLVPYGCREACRLDEVCRASDLRCVVPTNDCNPRCGSGQACVSARCVNVDDPPAFRDVPVARGLWPALAILPSGDAIVVYHDRVDRNLKLVRVTGPDLTTGPIETRVLAGAGADSSDETGLFPSLYVTPSGAELHVAFMNATRRSLVYLNLDATLRVITREVVDDGLDPAQGPDGLLLGADPAVVVDANGVVRVAYQDATSGDLRWARRLPGGTWEKSVLRGDAMPYSGSYGFYTDQVLLPDRTTSIISTYKYFLSAPGGALNGIELVEPPR